MLWSSRRYETDKNVFLKILASQWPHSSLCQWKGLNVCWGTELVPDHRPNTGSVGSMFYHTVQPSIDKFNILSHWCPSHSLTRPQPHAHSNDTTRFLTPRSLPFVPRSLPSITEGRCQWNMYFTSIAYLCHVIFPMFYTSRDCMVPS